MYGLVNKAVQGLITKEFGEEKWNEIKTKAGFEDEIFVSMQKYDDSITYNLVGAASEVLNVSGEDLLEAFGEYWVLYTAEEGYGEMLDMAGSTFVEFLGNLNHLHMRVGDVMPELEPPSFEVETISECELRLYYSSKREGLNPMVLGLVKGLGKRFDVKDLNVVLEETNVEGEIFKNTFKVSWGNNQT